MNKAEMRLIMRQKRVGLMPNDARRKSQAIAVNVKRSVNWQAVRTMHVYRSAAKLNEVDTDWFAAFIFELWPNIQLTIGEIAKSAQQPQQQYDVIVVPLLAFDERRHRLGFGGGWYDRFLSTQKQAVTIGLAYEIQRVSQVLVEPHDVPLSMVVTESKIYTDVLP